MKSRKTASICTRKTARTAVSLPALAWQNLFVPSGRKAAGASKASPRRISRVFEYFSPNHAYANSRNFKRNRAISRIPARRYAISWVRARFALSHTISRKCNQQFRSGGNMHLCDYTLIYLPIYTEWNNFLTLALQMCLQLQTIWMALKTQHKRYV